MKKTSTPLKFLLCMLLACMSCKKDSKDETITQPSVDLKTFNYETILMGEIGLKGKAQMAGATFELYTKDPLNGGKLLGKGKMSPTGSFNTTYTLPTSLKSVYFKSTYIGLPGGFNIDIVNGKLDYDFSKTSGKREGGSIYPGVETVNALIYKYMGSYNNKGVPDYLLSPGDVVDQALINTCNASLPEGAPVPSANPHYLATGNSTDLNLSDYADVWITFMHEGAGYRNSLGYYVYNTNSPPATVSDIDTIFHIFPNVSFNGSGGGLATGNKVHLGTFSPGKSIGWVLFQNAWNGNGVNTNSQKFYSNPDFNPESTASKRQHNVQLYDAQRSLVLIGFEDLHRENSSANPYGYGTDEDFNDAVFYISANPISSITTASLPPVTNSGNDSDGDGVPDSQDDYPSDATKAFNNYVPFDGGYSSVAFEDLWPSRGDYDFNDLVIKANYNTITNGVNELVQMDMELIVDHIGASFHNGFGIELPVDPVEVQSVTGYNLTKSIVTLDNKGLETGQSKAVVIVFDDAFDNRDDTLRITVKFTSTVNHSLFNQLGLNPFIFVNGDRGREVHLPNKAPTSKMNSQFLGSIADVSNAANGVYFKTLLNEPWAINISHSYKPPKERVNIKEAYLKFNDWVTSNGLTFLDWYENNNGYRNPNKVQE